MRDFLTKVFAVVMSFGIPFASGLFLGLMWGREIWRD